MRVLVLAAVWAALFAGAALAQTAPSTTAPAKAGALPPPKVPPMQIAIVSAVNTGCAPDCPQWIAAQGRIVAETLPLFKKVLQEAGDRRLPVLIDSNGGSVGEALAIGRLIRAKGLDVAVTKTEMVPCPAAEPGCLTAKGRPVITGRPRANFAKCASSCAFILAAGTRRYVGARAFVGVHQVSSFQTYSQVLRRYRVLPQPLFGAPGQKTKQLISEQKISEKTVQTKTAEATYTKIKVFFAEMGIDEAIVPILMTTLPTDIHWLTRAELTSTRMATDFTDGEQLITGVAAPVPVADLVYDPFRPTGTPLLPKPCTSFGGIAAGCGLVKVEPKPDSRPAPVTAPVSPSATASSMPEPTTSDPTLAVAARDAAADTTPMAAPVTAPADDARAVAVALQQGLKAAGCFVGEADGKWGDRSARALSDFAAHAKMTLYSLEPSKAALAAVQSKSGRLCPLTCNDGETVLAGRCAHPSAAVSGTTQPAGTKAPAPAAAGTPLAEPAPKVPAQRSASARAGAPPALNPNCACPQMRTCTGSWSNMTCNQLKTLCRNGDPLTYTKNGCARLKQIVGF